MKYAFAGSMLQQSHCEIVLVCGMVRHVSQTGCEEGAEDELEEEEEEAEEEENVWVERNSEPEEG